MRMDGIQKPPLPCTPPPGVPFSSTPTRHATPRHPLPLTPPQTPALYGTVLPPAVPLAYVVQYWEPSTTDALSMRAIILAKSVLYWMLDIGWPVGSGATLVAVSLYLTCSGYARRRRRALAGVLADVAERRVRVGRHERAMVAALVKVGGCVSWMGTVCA